MILFILFSLGCILTVTIGCTHYFASTAAANKLAREHGYRDWKDAAFGLEIAPARPIGRIKPKEITDTLRRRPKSE